MIPVAVCDGDCLKACQSGAGSKCDLDRCANLRPGFGQKRRTAISVDDFPERTISDRGQSGVGMPT